MAVNRYRKHLVIFLEDQPYREIVNGAKNLPQVDESLVDVKQPAGGWKKVFAELEDNLQLLRNNTNMHALLLMDFDNAFAQRQRHLHELVGADPVSERVFMLGIDHKESEDLKRALGVSDNERIAKILLEDCPEATAKVWNEANLLCNKDEIQRMTDKGVLTWLFQ